MKKTKQKHNNWCLKECVQQREGMDNSAIEKMYK